jgi:hypothetical protein
VADTKITFDRRYPDEYNRHVFERAVPKLVVFSRSVCVGVAGGDPRGAVRLVTQCRQSPVHELVSRLKLATETTDREFLICALSPQPRLQVVFKGDVHDRTSIGQAWIGDADGFDAYQRARSAVPDETDPGLEMLMSLQSVLGNAAVPSVDGFHVRVAAASDGFRFVGDATTWYEGEWHGTVSGTHMNLSAEDAQPLTADCLPGRDPTRGALAFVLPEAPNGGFGVLYTHQQPWQAIRLESARSRDETRVGARRHGQVV